MALARFCRVHADVLARGRFGRGLRCELSFGVLEASIEDLPSILVRVICAQEDPEPGSVVRDIVERIVVRAEVGVFYVLQRRRILTDLGGGCM